MTNHFAIILNDNQFIPVTPEESVEFKNDEDKLNFALPFLNEQDIEQDFIKGISTVEDAENNENYKKVQWYENKFLIFLKDKTYIQIEVQSFNPLSLEKKMEHAITHLKATGHNPDQFSHIGSEKELDSKTKSLLFSWVLSGIFILGFLYFIFK
ncbi:MAG: hypothetical protein ACTJH9_06535 [Pseudoalteromonas sp.]|uniref:hypothetical protein n=1 Tax=unclassified Pseudoalteromonas TaxID=194690 RepID=UPI003F9B37D4